MGGPTTARTRPQKLDAGGPTTAAGRGRVVRLAGRVRRADRVTPVRVEAGQPGRLRDRQRGRGQLHERVDRPAAVACDDAVHQAAGLRPGRARTVIPRCCTGRHSRTISSQDLTAASGLARPAQVPLQALVAEQRHERAEAQRLGSARWCASAAPRLARRPAPTAGMPVQRWIDCRSSASLQSLGCRLPVAGGVPPAQHGRQLGPDQRVEGPAPETAVRLQRGTEPLDRFAERSAAAAATLRIRSRGQGTCPSYGATGRWANGANLATSSVARSPSPSSAAVSCSSRSPFRPVVAAAVRV